MRRSLWKRCLRMCLLVMLICIGYAVLPSAAQEANAAAYGFRTTKGNTYFYDKNGKKHKGWLTYKGNKYYFDKRQGFSLRAGSMTVQRIKSAILQKERASW